MSRRRNPLQFAKALLSLLLVLVSVAAPVIAETYVCPMAKAAAGSAPSCCTQASVSVSAASGEVSWARECDCPKVSWDADVTDQARQSSTSGLWESVQGLVPAPIPQAMPAQVFAWSASAAFQQGPSRSLWLEHQSIRC